MKTAIKLHALNWMLKKAESVVGGDAEVIFQTPNDEFLVGDVEWFRLHSDATKPYVVAILELGMDGPR